MSKLATHFIRHDGTHSVTQLRRTGNVCLFQIKRHHTSRIIGFEVFTTHHELYPTQSDFSRTAWYYRHDELARAEAKFGELVEKAEYTANIAAQMKAGEPRIPLQNSP